MDQWTSNYNSTERLFNAKGEQFINIGRFRGPQFRPPISRRFLIFSLISPMKTTSLHPAALGPS